MRFRVDLCSRRRLSSPGDSQQGGFAAAGRPDNRDELAGVHGGESMLLASATVPFGNCIATRRKSSSVSLNAALREIS
jgi:hypothetical protein